MTKLFFDDLTVGQRFQSSSIRVDEDRIKAFAEEFDPQAFHLDDGAAKKTPFSGLAASGWHTAAITMRLLVDSVPLAGGIVGLGGEIAWPRPTRPGDVLTVETTVLEKSKSSTRPDRGTVTMRSQTRNHAGEVVQRATMNVVVPIKPNPAG